MTVCARQPALRVMVASSAITCVANERDAMRGAGAVASAAGQVVVTDMSKGTSRRVLDRSTDLEVLRDRGLKRGRAGWRPSRARRRQDDEHQACVFSCNSDSGAPARSTHDNPAWRWPT